MRWRPICLATAFAGTLSGTALSTPTFPEVMQSTWALSFSPPCADCHAGGLTQRGTVSTPLGRALRAKGMAAYDEESLRRALSELQKQAIDSDKDGVGDADELKAGDDPNRSSGPTGLEDSAGALVPPDYGCSVRGAGRERGSSAMNYWYWVALGALGVGRRAKSLARLPSRRGEFEP